MIFPYRAHCLQFKTPRRNGEPAKAVEIFAKFLLTSRNSLSGSQAMYRTLHSQLALAMTLCSSANADEIILEQIYGQGVHSFNAGDFTGAHAHLLLPSKAAQRSASVLLPRTC